MFSTVIIVSSMLEFHIRAKNMKHFFGLHPQHEYDICFKISFQNLTTSA